MSREWRAEKDGMHSNGRMEMYYERVSEGRREGEERARVRDYTAA